MRAGLLRLLAGLLLLLCSLPTLAQSPACQAEITQIQVARGQADAPPVAGWEPVVLPDYWKWRWPGYVGSAWYRLDWQTDCQPVALTLNSIIMAGEVFLNGELLWRDRHLVEPLSRSWAMPRYWLLPERLLNPAGNTLLIRVVGQADNNAGLGDVSLGDPEAQQVLYDRYHWASRSLPLINLVVSSVLGVLAFGVWLAYRREAVFGWYALTAFLWVVFAHRMLVTETWPLVNSLDAARFVAGFYVLFMASICHFFWSLLDLNSRRLKWPLLGLLLFALLLILVAPDFLGPAWAGHLATLVFLINCPYVLWKGFRSSNPEHRIIALGLLLLLLVAVHDVLSLLQVIPSRTHFALYSCIGFLLLIACLLGLRIARNARQVARFNQEMMQTVARVSAELKDQLGREHRLALDNSQLQERLRLAHELHDGIGGQIVRSIIQVEQSSAPLGKTQFLSLLKLLRDDLRQVIDSGAGDGIAAPESPEIWAAPLMYRFDNLFDELGVALEWQLPQSWITPPTALQCLLLARVVEEALTNVLKHSQAKWVRIDLQLDDPASLQLVIEDNGIGFDVSSVRLNGLGVGLESMKNRMERANGTLLIDSSPGVTRLWVSLPLRT